MSIADVVIGKSLASDEDAEQRVGPAAAIPIFGLDALGSAAYGPEAALTILIPLGAVGLGYAVPITVSIVILLSIVYFSYRQTIAAYPTGGGSYTVARANLGARVGVLAAAALMIDYLLNVAVGISTGVGALISALPSLQIYTLPLCLVILLLLTIVNLRGVKAAGVAFMIPTYLFVACLCGAIGWGVLQTVLSGGHASPIVAPPKIHAAVAGFSAWLLIKAFASGCTAMTGVEAVSNGVQAFREPVIKTAQRTLTVIIALLIVMLLGIGYLARAYQIGATEPGGSGYESLLSQLLGAVFGKGVLYYVSIASILMVLALSANTSFADFPRLCRAVAQNGFLPYGFAARGRRLVYSYGIYVLAALSAVLLIIFGGVTDRLIPLFAIGAFLSFTLSQAGMVVHWRKNKGAHSTKSLLVNALGATATGITVIIVLIAKFTEGAWMTVIMIPALILLMGMIRRHYHKVNLEIACPPAVEPAEMQRPLAVVPIDSWSRVSRKALSFAMAMSDRVEALHIDCGEEPDQLQRQWSEWVAEPAQNSRMAPPKLVVLKSPYRHVIGPIAQYVIDLEKNNPDKEIAVVISELVERHWYQGFLHNQRARTLTSLLTRNGNQRIVVVNVPWYFGQQEATKPAKQVPVEVSQ